MKEQMDFIKPLARPKIMNINPFKYSGYRLVIFSLALILLTGISAEGARYIPDKAVDVWRLRYNKRGPGWADLSDGQIGVGGGHLRSINRGDKRDTHLAFPDGHVSNPQTIDAFTSPSFGNRNRENVSEPMRAPR